MTLDEISTLIRARRTSMLVDRDRGVPRELVDGLCELAQWAPNHKRTWPCRYAIVEGDGRRMLGEAVADAMELQGDPTEKVTKSRTKYLRTPCTLVVGAAAGDSPLRTAENRDTAAAGVQNILLGATAAGLASYWSSCPKGANDVVANVCGFAPDTQIVALVYLGWPTSAVEVPSRPPAEITVVAS
jgi:nitroreductase